MSVTRFTVDVNADIGFFGCAAKTHTKTKKKAMNKSIVVLLSALGLFALGLGACKSAPKPRPAEAAKEAPKEAVKEAPKEEPLQPLVVTYNGEDLGMKTFIGYSNGGQALRLSFSSAEPTCEDFQGFGRGIAKDEKYLEMTIAPKVADDSSTSWQIRTLFIKNRNVIEKGPVEVISAEPGGKIHVRFDTTIDFEASDFLGQEAGTLVIKGDMVIPEGCGIVPRDKEAVAEEHPELEVTLGGQKMAIRSAKVVSNDLILATSPLGCIDDSIGHDVHIKIKFEYITNIPEGVLLNGDLIDQNINIGFDPETSTFKVPKSLEGKDLKEFELDFSFPSPPLTVKGKVVAQGCD